MKLPNGFVCLRTFLSTLSSSGLLSPRKAQRGRVSPLSSSSVLAKALGGANTLLHATVHSENLGSGGRQMSANIPVSPRGTT